MGGADGPALFVSADGNAAARAWMPPTRKGIGTTGRPSGGLFLYEDGSMIRPEHAGGRGDAAAPAATPSEAPMYDPEALRALAEIGCTVEEAAAWLDLPEAALAAALDAPPLSETWARGAARGRVILRKAQFAHAAKSASMSVLLGKLRLGQTDAAASGGLTIIVDSGIDRDPDTQN